MGSYRLDHVCLAVRALEPAREMLETMFGYHPRTEPVENTRQKVIVQFMSKAGSIDIKLVQPSSPDSPLIEALKKGGGGLHHLAFRTESVHDGLAELESKGARIIAPAQPGEAFEDADIGFAFVGTGLNVELIDTDRRRSQK